MSKEKMFRITPKNKKLLKSSKVRAWFRYVEDEIQKEMNKPKVKKAMDDIRQKLIREAIYGPSPAMKALPILKTKERFDNMWDKFHKERGSYTIKRKKI